MVIENCAVVFLCRIFTFFEFWRFCDRVTVLRQVFSRPEVELLIFEQVFAVLFDATELGGVGIAPVIVDDFVQLLL